MKYYEACCGILLARFCMIDTKMWDNLGHFLKVCVDFARTCFFGYEPGNSLECEKMKKPRNKAIAGVSIGPV
jgi:hypothetical protein